MNTTVGYTSQQSPMVGPDGAVPWEITQAISQAWVQGPVGQHHRDLMRAFVSEMCQALADSRAQVLADRAELDGYRRRYCDEQERRTA